MSISRFLRRCLRSAQQFAALSTTPNFYDSTIEKVRSLLCVPFLSKYSTQYAAAPIKKLSLTQMLSVGQFAMKDDAVLLKHARFVQAELPKRLARRLLDLRFLPHVIITNPHIMHVYDAYYKAFDIFLGLQKIHTLDQNRELTDILKKLLDEHAPMLDLLACGLRECLVRRSLSEKIDLQPFLESMLRSRISRRVIAEHHIGLNDQRKGFIGCVCTDLNVQQAILSAANRAQSVCQGNYGKAPEIEITSSQAVLMSYLPIHLDYMLYELFKNSMRAIMEHNFQEVPTIKIKICASESNVTIRISDEGGGIRLEHLSEIWNYGFSTSSTTDYKPTTPQSFVFDSQSIMSSSKLSGYGFGLPFSKLHAKYFDGDLQLISIPGYGVDTFLTIKKLQRQDWQEDNLDLESSDRLIYTGVERY